MGGREAGVPSSGDGPPFSQHLHQNVREEDGRRFSSRGVLCLSHCVHVSAWISILSVVYRIFPYPVMGGANARARTHTHVHTHTRSLTNEALPLGDEAATHTHDESKKKRHEVWRRYSEFEVLRNFFGIVYPYVSGMSVYTGTIRHTDSIIHSHLFVKGRFSICFVYLY